MALEKAKNLFNLFGIPLDYNIDMALLKKNYFTLSKQTHPDIVYAFKDSTPHSGIISRNSTMQSKDVNNKSNFIPKQIIDSKVLNDAYAILKDDFKRAKLFTKPVKQIQTDFLEKCLNLEERISEGRNITELTTELENEIEKCKKAYDNPMALGKWAYFKGLLEKIKN